MLASRLLGVLPEMSKAESLASACIHSLYCDNTQGKQDYQQRPFRAPHHSASAAAMVGGGNPPQPGEVSLAHNGVLFLDELPEFQRKVLEVLREPLECGEIRLSRARHQICYPANFQLIAAMNPCPCGYYGSASQRCRCSPDQVERYRQKISGPLLDRIDIHITVNTPTAGSIIKPERNGESSEQVKQRVVAARQRQLQRQGCSNSELDNRALLQHGALDVANQAFMQQAMERLGFSARAYYRVIKLARTLADLEAETTIKQQHLSEALGYRSLDRQPS
jgi:magnesium chelatase family protein